jgi:peroxiredoxin Q/BCP
MKAHDFSLPDQDGKVHTLAEYAGKWLVLYFYPEDDTAGCTTEACAFRDGRDVLASAGVEVVGVSHDSADSHRKFADKHSLNFTLLSDESGDVIKAYGAWDGKKAKRMTMLIDPKGQIAKEYPAVNPDIHFAEVVTDLELLQA